MNTDLISYYKRRAAEYEAVYAKAGRQPDLVRATGVLQDLVSGKRVLEIAAGTGYWTERLAVTAAAVHATDINREVLDIARSKDYPRANVTFAEIDMYNLTANGYDVLFGGFIWSHIRNEQLGRFLHAVSSLVVPNGMMVFMDNRFVAGSNLPVTHTDEEGNTFQTRSLSDGSSHLILKNFPSRKRVETELEKVAHDILYVELDHFWLASCRTNVIDHAKS
jgi:protein-L-isoaspartate O-methyltransferase